MNLIDDITRAKFHATEQQVEALASVVVEGSEASGTYLKILTATCLGALTPGRRRKTTEAEALAIVDKVHQTFYPAILRGVGPETLDPKERNRRAIFARTSAATLRAYIQGGGDLKDLDPTTVTKSRLRAAIAPPVSGDRAERILQRSQEALVRAAQRLAKRDPDEARERLQEAMVALQDVLEALEKPRPEVTKVRERYVGEERRAPAPN